MSVKEQIRDLSKLKKNAELACRLLFQECYKAGITNIFITETLRTPARQEYLWEQGRTRPGKKVTWTKNSNHFGGLAWDIATSGPNLYDETVLRKVGAIAKKLNITWGGYWTKTPDMPHFEVKSNWTMPSGYSLKGTVIVPSNSKLKVQLIVVDKEEEDEVFNPNNKYLLSEADEYLKGAVAKKQIDKLWYDKLKKGTLTVSEFMALDIKIRRLEQGGK